VPPFYLSFLRPRAIAASVRPLKVTHARDALQVEPFRLKAAPDVQRLAGRNFHLLPQILVLFFFLRRRFAIMV
jgi:hypothetical protein